MSDHDDVLDKWSPETRAQFEQLRQYLDRVAPPWLRREQPKPKRTRNQRRSKQQGPQSQTQSEQRRPGGRRSLLEGRDLPAMSALYARKRDKWQEWLWRAVLRESIQLLAEVGTRRFTVTEVAKRVGIARSTVYKYFGMKSELLAFCAEKYWFGGQAAHLQASERIAYRVVLEGLADDEDRGGDGPPIVDLLAEYVFAAARCPERSLWLLTAAESVRAVRPPQFCQPRPEPSPIRDGVRECLAAIVSGGRDPAMKQAGPALTDEASATVLYVMNALIWYEACLNGPPDDSRWPPQRHTPRISHFKWLRLRRETPAPQQTHPATCRRAIQWLLRGAGIAEQRLPHLPPLPTGRLPMRLRSDHPTGRTVHRLQTAANQIDFDDDETLVPWSFPKTPPLDPPPRLPSGRPLALPSN